MVTKREWLVDQGLAKGDRGRFSKAAEEAFAKAVEGGLVVDEPSKEVSGGESVPTP